MSPALCCPHVASSRKAGLLDAAPGPARSPFRTGNVFRSLSPEHPRPWPKPLRKHPASALQSGSSANLSAPNRSYILRRTGASLGPRGLPHSPLPASRPPFPRLPTQACQQAGRKLFIVGRVGHFQLTLNNPGLGYKEQGPSAPSPSTRHLPQPLHTPQEPGPSLPQGQRIPQALSGFLLQDRSQEQGLLPSEGAGSAKGLATHPQNVCHPPGPGQMGLGAGLPPAPAVAENTATVRD